MIVGRGQHSGEPVDGEHAIESESSRVSFDSVLRRTAAGNLETREQAASSEGGPGEGCPQGSRARREEASQGGAEQAGAGERGFTAGAGEDQIRERADEEQGPASVEGRPGRR